VIKALLEAMRPYQWVKNLLVFAPLVFAQKLYDRPSQIGALIAFAAFCCVASGIYLLNDILDLERDRQHPKKKNRPLPSGRLGPQVAAGAVVVLVGIGLGLAWWKAFLILPLVYFLINVAYSLKLKHLVILDAMCIAIGFLLRVYAGGVAINVPVSSWLVLCTFFVALLLAFCKRRHELFILGEEDASGHRKSLEHYSFAFLDQMIAPLGALTVMAYAAYTTSPAAVANFGQERAHLLVWTVPFVVYGIFRYLFLVHMRSEGGDPTRLLMKDIPTMLNILGWFGTSLWIVYH
jgi:4-hydroxybenzoate polyprenyltransferase